MAFQFYLNPQRRKLLGKDQVTFLGYQFKFPICPRQAQWVSWYTSSVGSFSYPKIILNVNNNYFMHILIS